MEMKDVIISIKGSQNGLAGEIDGIEFVTQGKYLCQDGVVTFTYMESELTGLAGTKTSFTVDPMMGVTMLREGRLCSKMVFQEGKKHTFLYETPFGSSTMGVNTHKIQSKLGENGGEVVIDYIVDFDHSYIGRNKFIINVREQKRGARDWQI